MDTTEIAVAGANATVPCAEVNGKTVVVTGRLIRVAEVRDEDWQEGEVVPCPTEFARTIAKQHQVLGADLFTFAQRPPDVVPRYPFYHEWESIAVIPLVSYADWWTKRVSSDLRCDVRKAAKRGVVVRSVDFTDDLVCAIKEIYDETPVRQGRTFWHYKKGLEAVRAANSTYLERSEFLAAFDGEQIIGFVKLVYVDRLARLMQILSKESCRDKRPTNALIAQAVQTAVNRGCSHLTYGNYIYSQGADSVTAFKRRNGFEEMLVPRYYLPLTARGIMALRFGLQRGPKTLMPRPMVRALRRIRASVYRLWPNLAKA